MQHLKEKLEFIQQEIEKTKKFLDFESKQSEIKALETEMSQEGFWDDTKNAQKVSKHAGHLQNLIESWETLEKDVQENLELYDLVDTTDPAAHKEFEDAVIDLEKRHHKLDTQAYLSGPYDTSNAIIQIHAGAGGTDAQDWGEMLLRMYIRFCERFGFETKLVSKNTGDQAGIKDAEIEIKGDYAYGFLKEEMGTHRLVRLSPFNSKNTRETSFVLVEVVPEVDNDELEINPADLKIETMRGSGHGGQSVNTTDSAVRITHIPTGIVATSGEKSQLRNKEKALLTIKSKLIALQHKHHLDKISEIKGDHVQGSWGNQIRSYVLHPYQMVKDHRTDYETSKVDDVLDGDLEQFIEASLRKPQSNL